MHLYRSRFKLQNRSASFSSLQIRIAVTKTACGLHQPKALKIWNPTNSTHYYVEARTKTGFDGSVMAGVIVHSGSPTNGNSSYERDIAPTTTTRDSMLDVGQVFNDSAIGLNIQTLSTSASGSVVSIIFGAIPCTTAAPSVSLANSSFLKHTVTVTNNDDQACSAAPFAFSANVPGGWTASFNPANVSSLAPGSTASATLTLTAPSSTSGTYSFAATATNGSTGQSGSATGSVTLLAALK